MFYIRVQIKKCESEKLVRDWRGGYNTEKKDCFGVEGWWWKNVHGVTLGRGVVRVTPGEDILVFYSMYILLSY